MDTRSLDAQMREIETIRKMLWEVELEIEDLNRDFVSRYKNLMEKKTHLKDNLDLMEHWYSLRKNKKKV